MLAIATRYLDRSFAYGFSAQRKRNKKRPGTNGSRRLGNTDRLKNFRIFLCATSNSRLRYDFRLRISLIIASAIWRTSSFGSSFTLAIHTRKLSTFTRH